MASDARGSDDGPVRDADRGTETLQPTSAVLVVGAGAAGLACAARLRRVGIAATVLEQADTVAVPWRERYDSLRLNTSRWFSQLPGHRFPRTAGMFPTRDDVVRYLESFAAAHELDIRYGVKVQRLDRARSDQAAFDGVAVDGVRRDDAAMEVGQPHWRVTTSRGVLDATHIVVATGLLRVPYVPQWPGRSRYAGTLLAAADYREPTAFRGDDVLVAGAGCSGMEIATEVAAAGARNVYLAVRNPPNILLRSIGGVPGDPAAMIMLRLPPAVADRQVALIRRLTVGGLGSHGLPVPREGPFQRLARTGDGPAIVDRAALRAIRSGRVRVVSAVAALDVAGARLTDGAHVAAQWIIAATGYRTGLAEMVAHLGVLDERDRPACTGGDKALPGLHFAGFRPQPGQLGAFGREAERIAAAVVGCTARATRQVAR